jgi:phage host-nuclease inhibitor protein Gam
MHTKLTHAENQRKQAVKELSAAKRNEGNTKSSLTDKIHELNVLQEKYEEKLDEKKDIRGELEAKYRQNVDNLQFEIDYLRKELENAMKKNHAQDIIQKEFKNEPTF